MNCLSCEKAVGKTGQAYHPACARRLFGTPTAPRIDFGYADIPAQARKLVGTMSLSGVQPKLSVAIQRGKLIIAPSGGTHILKPTPEAFPLLSENENLCMTLARNMGHDTPPHGLVRLAEGRLAYIVRRFDRDKQGHKIHVEDFAQLLEQTDKYDGSVEQIGRFLKAHSATPYIDTQKLFAAALLSLLIGNGDAHLKNFAMLRLPSGYRLAPLYDLVNSRLAMPAESDDMAIPLNGRRNRIDMRDFEALADYLEIPDKPRRRIFASAQRFPETLARCVGNSFLPDSLRQAFIAICTERFQRVFRQAG